MTKLIVNVKSSMRERMKEISLSIEQKVKGTEMWEKNEEIREPSKSSNIQMDVQKEKTHKTEENKREFLKEEKQHFRMSGPRECRRR